MESVPVRCPACRRDHAYSPPAYPCPCGAPTAPPLLPGARAVPITHRTWNDDWVTVRCPACGRRDQWPQPELCCPCGTVLRVPVRPVAAPGDGPPAPRPAFRAVAIHSAGDALATAARYLSWLGYREVVRSPKPSPARIDLRATGLMAQVDTAGRPTTLRDVECLWLHALGASVTGVLFSLTGYAPDAAARAEGLGLPLFVMDPAGTPRPVNSPADELLSTGA
ncbi:hypothetical protein [Streptomyces sp. NPDC001966]